MVTQIDLISVDLDRVVVTAAQMRQIEELVFDLGMPIPALMEKASLSMASYLQQQYPQKKYSRVGVLVGPGHNGGDALVVARELYLLGYQVKLACPFSKVKELTQKHLDYGQKALELPIYPDLRPLADVDLFVDGCFGFGLTRPITEELAEMIANLNQWQKPVVSIDLPSGIDTDTGAVLGIAVKATETLCLGLWKRAIYQDQALAYVGKAVRIDLGIPPRIVARVLGNTPFVQLIDSPQAQQFLPTPRPLVTHKYQQGHILLICGSHRYAGGAILAALGARGSGVGMLSVAVPHSLKPILVSHLPEALIIGCPETETGAIASLPVELDDYGAIACGPGLTQEAENVVRQVLQVQMPLILDADALNIIAHKHLRETICQRSHPTILTPHLGELKRLFPDISEPAGDRIAITLEAAAISKSVVLYKGARTAIASPQGKIYLVSESTPALARGGSGDVLTGLIGGLVAQSYPQTQPLDLVATAAWWHSQAAIAAVQERGELGVDAFTLTQYLATVTRGY